MVGFAFCKPADALVFYLQNALGYQHGP